ncbi:MAG TPA: molybdopterin cofactor-binding domain-containing protein, partial [Gemmatimonadales bacterium]|nr:molybdopterin cofactor-binding domain-containing protein [Gemmatimonadales bacterium]
MTGAAKYTDDLVFPGAWYGKTVRSTVPAGRLRSITLDPAFDWSRVVVVTAEDIPGENVVHLIRDDQPVLARVGGEIRHKEEPVLLLAGPDRASVEEAGRHIRIEYDQTTPVYDLDKATEVYSTIEIRKGEVGEVVEGVEVVQHTFRVGLQEQLYIEPQGAIAIPEAGGAIRVVGSLQCPYYVHRALKRALKLTDTQAIVVQAETGGGFGGKEE